MLTIKVKRVVTMLLKEFVTETSKRVITGKTQVVITGLYKKVLDTSKCYISKQASTFRVFKKPLKILLLITILW